LYGKSEHISFQNTLSKTCAIYEIILKKIAGVRQATDDAKIRRKRFACWIPKTTDTHSEYAITIAFPLQLWLHERPSTLRYTYIARLISAK